jgi:hypothetical protein
MNYKTIFMLAAMTVAAAFVAIGSATPIFESGFTQDQNVNTGCNGDNTGDCRCVIGQNNQSGNNDNSGEINFN